MPDHDVIVVGAGPVGLLLACLLAQQGRQVAVFDAREGADLRSRAIGLHPPGQDALDAVGLGDAVRAEALALEGGEVICDGRLLAALDFPVERRVRTLAQQRTDALLRGRLNALDDAALRLGHRVTAVRDDGDAVHASLLTTEGRSQVTAALLVAADGVRSGVREAVGIPWLARQGGAEYVMIDLSDPAPVRRAALYCGRDGLVESFPLPGGRRRWVIRDAGGTIRDAASFAEAIARRTSTEITLPAEAEPQVFRARQHAAEEVVRGRVVLLGDAAHEVSPIGGQGMNLGWIAAGALAGQISGLRLGDLPDLRAYRHRVRQATRRAQRRSAFYMAMGRPASGVGLRARNAAIRVLGSPLLRARTAGMLTMRGV